MKKYSLIAITAAFVATAISAQASLIQHLIATNDSPSVLTNGSGTVTNWLDISGNGNDTANAGGIIGTPKWPSTSLSASGQSGVDLGATRNGMRFWSIAAQDSWLDFTGGASGKSGFAVLVAFKVDGNPSSSARNIVMGNHGNPAANNSFVLKYETGFPGLYLNKGGTGPEYINTNSAAAIAAGDTLVFAFNYDATTGFWELWDSKSGGSMTNTIAAGNFSSSQNMWIGTTDNSSQFMNGMVGEILVYDNVLSSNELVTARQELVDRWVTPSAAILPPTLSAIGGDASAILNWLDNNPAGVVSNFYVYRSLESGSNYVAIATNATASFTDTGLINGTDYYYVLKALGTNGSLSAFSNEQSVTPVAISTNSELYQWLDASVSNSVITVFGEVLEWDDQTTNMNNGIPIVGTPLYPSTSLSGSGLSGVDCNPTNTGGRAGIQLFTAANQDPWLDFAGAAKTNGGFSALVAFKADTIDPTALNTVLGNHGNLGDPNSFGLRFSASGAMQAFFGGTAYAKSGNTVADGDTIVYGVTYDGQTGVVNFWDSKNNSTALFTNAPFKNLSSVQTMKVGASDNTGQWFNGMIGEVKIYKGKLDSAALVAEGQSLATKWGAVAANTNAYLASLVLSDGTLAPTFSSNVLSYTASVSNGVASITVTPTAADATATLAVRVNGGGYAAVASGLPSGSLALNEGTNTVDVRVTAQNPAYTNIYTTTVTRAPSPAPTPENIGTTVAGGNLILSWTQPTWKLATGTNVTAITNIIPGATSPFTNSLGSDPQRYYRLIYP